MDNIVDLVGKVGEVDIKMMYQYEKMYLIRFILESDYQSQYMIVGLGSNILDFKNKLKENDTVRVTGRLQCYSFRDANFTVHYTFFVFVKEFELESGEKLVLGMENDFNTTFETFLEVMKMNDYLPIPEDKYETMIEHMGGSLQW